MTREEVIQALSKIKEKYDLPELILFGSYARGETNENSDVDVAVRLPKSDVILLTNILMEAEECLGRDVDIVQLRDTMNPFLKKQIFEGGVHV